MAVIHDRVRTLALDFEQSERNQVLTDDQIDQIITLFAFMDDGQEKVNLLDIAIEYCKAARQKDVDKTPERAQQATLRINTLQQWQAYPAKYIVDVTLDDQGISTGLSESRVRTLIEQHRELGEAHHAIPQTGRDDAARQKADEALREIGSHESSLHFTEAEKTKLAGIQEGATKGGSGGGGEDDQARADIAEHKTATNPHQIDVSGKVDNSQFERHERSVHMTAAERTKLAGVGEGAQKNRTSAELKRDYESNSDTNAFTDAEKTKLAGIQDGATAGGGGGAAGAGTLDHVIENKSISAFATATGGEALGSIVLNDLKEDEFVEIIVEIKAEMRASRRGSTADRPSFIYAYDANFDDSWNIGTPDNISDDNGQFIFGRPSGRLFASSRFVSGSWTSDYIESLSNPTWEYHHTSADVTTRTIYLRGRRETLTNAFVRSSLINVYVLRSGGGGGGGSGMDTEARKEAAQNKIDISQHEAATNPHNIQVPDISGLATKTSVASEMAARLAGDDVKGLSTPLDFDQFGTLMNEQAASDNPGVLVVPIRLMGDTGGVSYDLNPGDVVYFPAKSRIGSHWFTIPTPDVTGVTKAQLDAEIALRVAGDDIQFSEVASAAEFTTELAAQKATETSAHLFRVSADFTHDGTDYKVDDVLYVMPRSDSVERWFNLKTIIPDTKLNANKSQVATPGLLTNDIWADIIDKRLNISPANTAVAFQIELGRQANSFTPLWIVATATYQARVGTNSYSVKDGDVWHIPPFSNVATRFWNTRDLGGDIGIEPNRIANKEALSRNYRVPVYNLNTDYLNARGVKQYEIWIKSRAVHVVSNWTPVSDFIVDINVNATEQTTIGLVDGDTIVPVQFVPRLPSGSAEVSMIRTTFLHIGGTGGDTSALEAKVTAIEANEWVTVRRQEKLLQVADLHISVTPKIREATSGAYTILFTNSNVVDAGTTFYQVALNGVIVQARKAWDQPASITVTPTAQQLVAINRVSQTQVSVSVEFYRQANGGAGAGSVVDVVPVRAASPAPKADMVLQAAVAGADGAGTVSVTLPANFATWKTLRSAAWEASDRVRICDTPTALLAAQTNNFDIREGGFSYLFRPSDRYWGRNPGHSGSSGGTLIYCVLTD